MTSVRTVCRSMAHTRTLTTLKRCKSWLHSRPLAATVLKRGEMQRKEPYTARPHTIGSSSLSFSLTHTYTLLLTEKLREGLDQRKETVLLLPGQKKKKKKWVVVARKYVTVRKRPLMSAPATRTKESALLLRLFEKEKKITFFLGAPYRHPTSISFFLCFYRNLIDVFFNLKSKRKWNIKNDRPPPPAP